MHVRKYLELAAFVSGMHLNAPDELFCALSAAPMNDIATPRSRDTLA